jgi:hypothetical protein
MNAVNFDCNASSSFSFVVMSQQCCDSRGQASIMKHLSTIDKLQNQMLEHLGTIEEDLDLSTLLWDGVLS